MQDQPDPADAPSADADQAVRLEAALDRIAAAGRPAPRPLPQTAYIAARLDRVIAELRAVLAP